MERTTGLLWTIMAGLALAGNARAAGEKEKENPFVAKAVAAIQGQLPAIEKQLRAMACVKGAGNIDFSGLVFSGNLGVKYGITGSLGADYTLFYDPKAKAIRGQFFVSPAATVGGTAGASVQIGVTLGCKGDPTNYEGYFLGVSAGPVQVNLGVHQYDGIHDDVFARLASVVEGLPEPASAKSYLELISDYHQHRRDMVWALRSLPKNEGWAMLARDSVWSPKTHSAPQPLDRATREFVSGMRQFESEAVDLLVRIDALRGKMKENSSAARTLAARREKDALILPELIATTEKMAEVSQRIARYSGALEWHPTANRGSRIMLKPNWPREPQKSNFEALAKLRTASLGELNALQGLLHVLINDRAALKLGKGFQSNRKVGGQPKSYKTFSGCNTVMMDPDVFATSGTSVVRQVMRLSARLDQKTGMPLMDVSRAVSRADASLLTRAASSVSNSFSAGLSYSYTPKDLKRRLGIPLDSVLGDGSFEYPVAKSPALQRLLDRDALCAPAGAHAAVAAAKGAAKPNHD